MQLKDLSEEKASTNGGEGLLLFQSRFLLTKPNILDYFGHVLYF